MSNLYQSSQRLKAIEELAQSIADEDIESEEIEAYLVAVEGNEAYFLQALDAELERKASLETLAAAAEFEYKRAKARYDALTKQAENSKEGIKKALIVTGRTKLELPSGHKLRVGQSDGGVDIIDEQALINWAIDMRAEGDLLRTKVTTEPNKKAIKEALKKGIQVRGVAIAEPTTYLKID